jgi:uncharacterized protein YqhQ
MHNAPSTNPARPYIGGQAVIEGVMMRSPKSFVVAVRRPDGGLAVREQAWSTLLPKLTFLRWPFFRGAVVLAEALHNGYSALKFSSEYGLPPEQGGAPTKPSVTSLLAFLFGAIVAAGDAPPPSNDGKRSEAGSNVMLTVATVVMVGFFIALPHVLTWLLGQWGGFDTTSFAFHLVDGVLRLGILLGYIALISRTEDAKTLFRYHGAEHKAIWVYEAEQALTVENARPHTTRHPRCGTSFLFIVVGVAVTMHVLLLPWVPRLHANELVNQLLMVLIKVPMAFPIAGVAYELQRWSAQPSCPAVITALTRPGIWLQRVTTQPPSDAQQEMALLALDRSLAREKGTPKGPEGIAQYDSFAAAAA